MSSSAAPAIRRKTTEPGVHPVSSSDFATGPDVANVAAESRAIRRPAPVVLVDIVHHLSGVKVWDTSYSREIDRQESM